MRSRSVMFVAVVSAGFGVVGCGGEGGALGRARSAASVAPVSLPGNPTCADAAAALGLAGTFFELKIDPPVSGTYQNAADGQSFTLTTDGTWFSWSSTIGVDFVISKGGNAADVYVYDPESKGDSDLVSPVNASGGPAGLSHATFCYDYEVEVTKTARTAFDRTFAWTIEKSSPISTLTLSTGQVYDVPYTVTVRTTGSTDSSWAVSGEIAIHNPAPFAAQVTDVADVMSGDPVAVSCSVAGSPASPPFEIPALGDATCAYGVSVSDGSDRTNVATVTTIGLVGGGSATAAVTFQDPTLRDACVDVVDSLAGALGQACQDAIPKTFSYLQPVSYGACGQYEIVNRAAYTALDTESSGDASWTISVDVPCATGCTLTQGYWKTHSAHGPARWPDDTWALVGGPDAPFYGSGLSFYEVLWTAQRGNPYFTLAHQFIAAELNGLNGATLAAAQPAYDLAEAFFAGATGTTVPKALRSSVAAWAVQLDAFNTGVVGPGHCSE